MGRMISYVCLLLVLVGLLGRFDDRLDAINFALPYIVVIGLAASLVKWGSGRGRAVLVSSALLAGSAPLLTDELFYRSGRGCGGPVLRLIQYNAFKQNNRTVADARWLIAAQPDVIVLEEVIRLSPMLANAYPYRQDCSGSGHCSTVILSRIRPRASGGAAEGDPENRRGLSAAWMRLPMAHGRYVTIVGVHLGRPWPFQRFAEDRDKLRSLVLRLGRETTIVAGDFNLPGWTYQMRHLEAGIGLQRATHGLRTWPAHVREWRWPVPLLNIDHILTGSRWQAWAGTAGPAAGSDHLPVSIKLMLCRG